ncbi:MAG: gas vesicle protein GvpO [Catenulispora sp.]
MPAEQHSSEREDRGRAKAESSADPLDADAGDADPGEADPGDEEWDKRDDDERDDRAEQEPAGEEAASGDESPAGGPPDGARPRRRQTGSGWSAAEAARAGMQFIAAVTGKKVNGATSVARDGDDWCVEVEVVEDPRIPSSAEVLALYAATLDGHGELLEYRRTKRYMRGRPG